MKYLKCSKQRHNSYLSVVLKNQVLHDSTYISPNNSQITYHQHTLPTASDYCNSKLFKETLWLKKRIISSNQNSNKSARKPNSEGPFLEGFRVSFKDLSSSCEMVSRITNFRFVTSS